MSSLDRQMQNIWKESPVWDIGWEISKLDIEWKGNCASFLIKSFFFGVWIFVIHLLKIPNKTVL